MGMSTKLPQRRGVFQHGRTRSIAHYGLNGKVFSLPMESIKDGSIEAGLLCLSLWLAEHPGAVLSRDEIAFVCGCSDSLIGAIENQAMGKLKKRHFALLINLLQQMVALPWLGARAVEQSASRSDTGDWHLLTTAGLPGPESAAT
jgi:hypothetical protein